MSAVEVSSNPSDAEGYWPVSLLDPECPRETSGTAFFVYGMAWGVDNGVLDADRFGPSVRRGWLALDAAVQPDGRLGWAQQVVYATDRVVATETKLYDVGPDGGIGNRSAMTGKAS